MLHEVPGGVVIATRVTPRASKSEIGGMRDGVLQVRLAAPPVDNAANEELTDVIARALGVPRRAVTLIAGERSRQKRLRVIGIDVTTARQRLDVSG